MPLIYFLRHGQTPFNAEGRIQGQIEVPLNELGRSQALRNGAVLAEVLGEPERFDFVGSPLLRTRQTMEIVRSAMGLPATAYRTDERLMEILFGAWGGMTWPEIQEKDPENFARRDVDTWNVAPPKGECFRELSERVVKWFSEVKQDTVVVSHGGVSRVLRAHILKLSPEEMMRLDVPQDKVMMIEGDCLTWL